MVQCDGLVICVPMLSKGVAHSTVNAVWRLEILTSQRHGSTQTARYCAAEHSVHLLNWDSLCGKSPLNDSNPRSETN